MHSQHNSTATKVNPYIVAAVVAAMFSIQGWTLTEVINLKVKMARMEEKMRLPYDGAVGSLEHKNPIMMVTSRESGE